MTDIVTHPPRQSAGVSAGVATLGLLALTSIHHAYGAIAFATPWRLHILLLAVPAAGAIVLALRRSAIVSALIILLIPVGAIGLYEGGYNHVVKNLVYLIGGEAEARALFPPPLYERPHDVSFEATGIAQFALAIATAILAFRLFWPWPR